MKIKKGYMLRQLKDQYLVVAVGTAAKEFSGMIRLNETGAFLWMQLKEEKNTQQLVQALMTEYDVDEVTAQKGVNRFLTSLQEVDCMEW